MLSSIGRAHWRSSCALAWRSDAHVRLLLLFISVSECYIRRPSHCYASRLARLARLASIFITPWAQFLGLRLLALASGSINIGSGEPPGGCGGQPSAHSWHFFSFTSLEMRLVPRLSWRAARLPGCWGCPAVGLPKCHVLLSNQINCRGWSCLPRWLASQRPLVSL